MRMSSGRPWISLPSIAPGGKQGRGWRRQRRGHSRSSDSLARQKISPRSSGDEQHIAFKSRRSRLNGGMAQKAPLERTGFTFHSSLFTWLLSCAALSGRTRKSEWQSKCRTRMRVCRSKHHFLIPGFRKDDVSQKRGTGEHRDRELGEAAMDEGKSELNPLVRRRAYMRFKSGDLNQQYVL